jgi:nucleolar protein 56
MIIFTHITGCYVFDEKGVLKEKKEFSVEDALYNSSQLEEGEWTDAEKAFIQKYPGSFYLGFKKEKIENCKTTQDPKKLALFSSFLNKLFEKTKEYNTILTKQKVRKSIQNDNLIIQTINNIDELTKVTNMLVKRLREWYELYNPEFSKSVFNHEKFIELILEKSKEELLKEVNVKPELSMGAEIGENNIKPILELARNLQTLYLLKEEQSIYLEKIMKETCPNITAIAGHLLGAKLLSLAGSLNHIAELPSSTIQLLGAEKALFRHIRSGSRAPKHGIIIEHPLVADSKNKGKAARMIANKISIAAKVDLYKGKFIGDTLRQDLEKKLK